MPRMRVAPRGAIMPLWRTLRPNWLSQGTLGMWPVWLSGAEVLNRHRPEKLTVVPYASPSVICRPGMSGPAPQHADGEEVAARMKNPCWQVVDAWHVITFGCPNLHSVHPCDVRLIDCAE